MSIYENVLRINKQVSKMKRRSVNCPLIHFGIVLVFLSMVSLVLLVFGEEFFMGQWLWISPAILFVACLGTAFRIIRTDIQMVASPVFWVLFASGVYWGFGPLIYTFGSLETKTLMENPHYIGVLGLFRTNMLNSIGMLVLLVGLIVGRRLVGRRPIGWVRRFEGLKALQVAAVLSVLGLTVKFLVVLPRAFGLIGTQSFTLLQMDILSKAALMILSYLSVTRGGKATFWFFLLFVTEILAGSVMIGKTYIMEPIIATMVGLTLGSGKPITMVKSGIILGLMLVVLQPVNLSRHKMAGRSIGQDYTTSVVNSGMNMIKSFSNLIQGTNAAQNAIPQSWWMRLCYTPQQVFAMREYDAGRPGSPWNDFFVAFIPRMLWSGKPLINPGASFSVLFDGNKNANNAPGVLGEGYWYGGWLGLLMVCLYTGIFLGGVDRVSIEVISRRVWILMPVVFLGIKNGFRIDGWFSTEFLFGSAWYVLFVVSWYYFSVFLLTMARVFLPSYRRSHAN
jgi:hypothetical protein